MEGLVGDGISSRKGAKNTLLTGIATRKQSSLLAKTKTHRLQERTISLCSSGDTIDTVYQISLYLTA